MLMNRIVPSASTLSLADSDGSGERPLLTASALDDHASFSPDGAEIVFTSERDGDGQSGLFRARADDRGFRRIASRPGFCLVPAHAI